MEVSISSNMTHEGTSVTLDGKKLKNIKSMNFGMYEKTEWADGPSGSYPTGVTPCINLRVCTEEEMEDGVVKEVEYSICKEGDGEAKVLDRKVKDLISDRQIVDELAKKMMLGQRSIL